MNKSRAKSKAKLLSGVNKVVDAVKVTLGAKGKTVLFNLSGEPQVTKDGVTVSYQVKSNNQTKQMAIDIVREAAKKTVKSSGDGTTTTMVLAQSLINEGYELINGDMPLTSYYQLSRELDVAYEAVKQQIQKLSLAPEKKQHFKKLKHVATISANDNEIGDLIFNIISDIGMYSDIEVKASTLSYDVVEQVKGLRTNKGFYNPYFVTDMVNMEYRREGVDVVLIEDSVKVLDDILSYLQECANAQKTQQPNIIFFVKDIEQTFLKNIIQNKNGVQSSAYANVIFVEHDGFGDRRLESLNDISALTGALVGNNKRKGTIGFAQEVIVNENTTSLIGGNINQELVDEFVKEANLKIKHKDATEEDKRYYKKRIAGLSGGIGVIYVGGVTEVEMKERKDRMDDAVEAVRAAVNGGIVIGGGYTLLSIVKHLKEEGNTLGMKLVLRAMESVFEQLCFNADVNAEEISEKMISEKKGYDLITNKFYDLSNYNVYDPAKVLTDALQNAISVAKTILSVECVLAVKAK